MSERHKVQLQITADGEVFIVDPDKALLQWAEELNPALAVQKAPPPASPPHFQQVRQVPAPWPREELPGVPTETLWHWHDKTVDTVFSGKWYGSMSSFTYHVSRITSPVNGDVSEEGSASLLDVKVELLQRLLEACQLCGRRCGINRWAGETGYCGLRAEAYVADQFLHCAEEEPINPSWTVNLQGCGWRCLYCQQADLLDVNPQRAQRLEGSVWKEVDMEAARSLTFIGGNPDESAYAILRCLREAPEDFSLPIVWNTHAYGTEALYRLLHGVVDCYVPDLRYGNDECAQRWSAAPNYWETVTSALQTMAAQPAGIIVRLLVLPGHLDCCHRPALHWLKRTLAGRVQVSVKAEYYPTFRIGEPHGAMNRRPTRAEVSAVMALVEELNLPTVPQASD